MTTAKIKLYRDPHGFFIADCDFASRTIPEKAGFIFSKKRLKWYTENFAVAARLREYADSVTKNIINKVMLEVTPWQGRIPHPAGLTPTFYQPIASKFCLSRNRWYLNAPPGTGKSIMAALCINGLNTRSPHRFVYICPPFLIKNVEYELEKWCAGLGVEHFMEPQLFGNIMILPDSRFNRPELEKELKSWLKGKPSLLIVDEAHRFKNHAADRTRYLLGYTNKKGETDEGIVDLFDRVGYMSGTPMQRPLDLYPILAKSAAETIDFRSEHDFGMKFCGGRWNGFGYDYTGAGNVQELASRIRGTFMYKLEKDVLKLPPLTEEVLVVADDMPAELVAFEHAVLKKHSPEDLMQGRIAHDFKFENMHLATYRRLLGLRTVPHALDALDFILDEGDESVLVFAHHKEVILKLQEGLIKRGEPFVLITGDTNASERYDMVEAFQNSKHLRVMLGNLRAMGVGFNITKATRIINVEPDWNPGTNDQGHKRAHRYGQTKPVFLQYICYKNSITTKVLEVNLRKRKLASYI